MITAWYLVLILGVGSSTTSVTIPQESREMCQKNGDEAYTKSKDNVTWTKVSYYFCVPGILK